MKPTFEVVCLDYFSNKATYGFINLNASITTFPFTLWIGSITTATDLGFNI